jgi:hypothetical protein
MKLEKEFADWARKNDIQYSYVWYGSREPPPPEWVGSGYMLDKKGAELHCRQQKDAKGLKPKWMAFSLKDRLAIHAAGLWRIGVADQQRAFIVQNMATRLGFEAVQGEGQCNKGLWIIHASFLPEVRGVPEQLMTLEEAEKWLEDYQRNM